MKKGHRPNYDFEVIKDLISKGYTLDKLGEKYNVCSSSIGRVLRKEKMEYNLQVRKIEKNHNFFENIDNELKAYLLGFFVADGCVYDNNRIGLCIAEQDKYIIDLFKDSIAPESYIKYIHNTKGAKIRQRQLVLRISSSKIVEDLSKYGILPRKTYLSLSIPNITDDLKHHFVRGYLDGDGYIGIRKQKYTTFRVIFANGDKNLLEEIQKFYGLGRLSDHTNYWKLEIEDSKKVKVFLDKIYENSNYRLPRKYEKYLLVNTEVIAKTKKLATP